jgi:hypothetical protein
MTVVCTGSNSSNSVYNGMKEATILIVLVVFTLTCVAQDDEKTHSFSFEPTYSLARNAEVGLSVGFRRYSYTETYLLAVFDYAYGPHIGMAYSFYPGGLLATKLGYTGMYGHGILRASLIHFTNFQEKMYSFRPEVGVSVLFGGISLTYGYDFPIGSADLFNKKGHVISIHMSLLPSNVCNSK